MNQKTPLFLAAASGSVPIIQMLFDYGAACDASSPKSGRSPLAEALRRKHIDCFNLLLSRGLKQSKTQDDREFSPLMWAISTQYLDAVPLLLGHGSDPSFLTSHKFSPLYLACQIKSVKTVEELCSAGVSVDLMGPGGSKPIHWAAASCEPEIVQILIERGTPVNAVNFQGDNAVFEVLRFGIHSVKETDLRKKDVENMIETLKILLEAGLNVNARRKDGSTPILNYVPMREKVDLRVLEFLLDNGFDWDMETPEGSGKTQGQKLISICIGEMKKFVQEKFEKKERLKKWSL